MTSDVSADICAFLKLSVGKHLNNFGIEVHEGNKKGEGYLGDLLFISLTDKKTSEVHHLVIKQALASGSAASLNLVSNIFHNESCFYETIWPAFEKFQDSFSNVEKFLNVSKHYAIDAKRGAEKICLENLKFRGFRNHVKTEFFKKEHLEYVLSIYGRFHAISFAFRELDPENFRKTTDSLVDDMADFAGMQFFQQAVNSCCQNALSTFDEESEKDVIDKFKAYAENGSKIFIEIKTYNGIHHALLHGDCWSNNIMFKYDEDDNIEDLRLIDFQLTKLGTVVYDLSYCIYASGSKEAIDDLDHYLRIYHHSLSQSLREYDLDPQLLYPYEVLQQEWKQYSKYGLILGILVNAGKFSDQESVPVITEIIDKQENDDEHILGNGLDDPSRRSEEFLNIARNLVLHAYENDFL